MDDDLVRNRELQMIDEVTKFLSRKKRKLNVLDLGCGNGYALSILSKSQPHNEYTGLDFTREMIGICLSRNLPNCRFVKGDARHTFLPDNRFHLVFTERCLINIPQWEEQIKALNEIHRILKPSSHLLLIECFTDGLKDLNRAREECGLPSLEPKPYNLYLDKEKFLQALEGKFKVMASPMKLSRDYMFYSNFLSSHYFVARVLHALITKGDQIKNTEVVKFFSYLPPIGNYSQLQAYFLRKT
jgi:ubiquinone/menaquinone biosynthesis C-methylase UbiE